MKIRLLVLMRSVALLILLLMPGISPGTSLRACNNQTVVVKRDVMVSVDFSDTPLSDALHVLETKTGFRFVYDQQDAFLRARVNLRKENVQFDIVLQAIAQQAAVKFKQINETIAVTSAPVVNKATAAGTSAAITITGQVTASDGNYPLPGVTILVKGTTVGASTDTDGRYTLQVQDDNAILVFSFIGFTSQEVPVNARSVIDVVMVPDVAELSEVVVIGYGEVERKDLTGSVASLAGKELEKIPLASTAQAMTGRLAGVQITTTDGAPDAEVVIRVRGGGSVTQDNSPLYIVDGFQVNNINNIPPTDIASIDVLKDAATAAIYGARGANGVIIITTKNPKAGKTSISYNGYVQTRTLPKKLDVLSPYEFALAQYEYAKLRGGTDLDNFTRYFGVYDDLELYKDQKGTDWQEELFGKQAISQYHNLSVSGGTEKTKLNFSLTNNTDEGILIGSGYKRTTINFKLNHELSKSLRFDFLPRFSITDVDGAGTSGGASLRISDGITTRPVNGLADAITIDPEDANGDYEQFMRSLINPKQLAAQDYRKRLEYSYVLNGGVSWSILKNLTYRGEFGIEYGFTNNKRYYGPLTGESANNGGNLPLGEITDSKSQRLRWANTLTYSLLLNNEHDLNVLVGQEAIETSGSSEFNRAKYFSESIDPEKLFANMALGTQDRHTTTVLPGEKLASFFGRINYQWRSRYLATFTLRYDGSSKFAPENRWGAFPSAALAWRISEESFAKQLRFLSDLKLRVSYGAAGNNRIGDNLWRRTYQITDNRPIGFGNITQPYYIAGSTTLVNPSLKWETTITRNVGLDFGVFQGRLSGTMDLYWNTTKDLLVESDIPSFLGYSKQMRNIGQTSNRGIELTLNSYIIDREDFSLSATFNISFNRPKIDKLDGVNSKPFNSGWAGTDLKSQDDYRVNVGQTVGLIYGYVTDGFYTTDDFSGYDAASGKYILKDGVANDAGMLGGTIGVRPGTLKLKNLGGDATITSEDDRTIIGRTVPKHTGGMGLNATYKGFDCSLFFTWSYGNDVYNTGKIANNMLYRTTYGNMLNTMNYNSRYKYIDAAGELVTDLEALKELNKGANIWSPFSTGTAVPVVHSWAIEDGSFLRLSNATVGYSLPTSLIARAKLQRFRLYATVNNAWLWTKYSGYDPEVSTTRSSTYSALTPGVDYSAYPKSRSFTVGLNATF